jgi:RNA polymerase-binding transcription factor DksA
MINDISLYIELVEKEYERVKNMLNQLGKPNFNNNENYDANSLDLNIDVSDREDVASKIESFETRVSEEAELEKRLNQIISAKAAILDGTYGTCIICGENISEERLNANPITTTCINCSSIDNTSSTL